jgi:predicted nucleotidyltransferase component of viral defense system
VISAADLAHWRRTVRWPDSNHVEQDLVLSRLIIEIARHPVLGNELVFRGGTCFHKLWLDQPWRYSEDLDYVRRSAGGVGEILDALREVAAASGFDDVRTQVGIHPKARLRSTFVSGDRMQVKVEMNTFERSPARPTVTRSFAVDSPWFSGSADVPTFAVEELTATKIRAMFQRSKGRDLFDLWLAIERAAVSPSAVAACFGPYRPAGWTVELAWANLAKKLADPTYTSDLDQLVQEWPDGYTAATGAAAARLVLEAIAVSETSQTNVNCSNA